MKSNFENKSYILTTQASQVVGEPIKLISSPIISNRNMNPLHTVGYLGSAILTKGKTGLGSLQQPLKELYSMYVLKSASQAQKRLLIISTEGLTFQWNDAGVEKFINNNLSSVYDVQLLKIVSEKRKDKKYYCAFLPMGEETEPRYSNLFHQLDKQHVKAFESPSAEICSNYPPIIALIMRRSQGIQALECHVLITRSACEANQIVNCIRSACSKYKFDISQQTDVFQYKPYTAAAVDNDSTTSTNNSAIINYENHVDLITGLNTSSNAISLMGHKEKLKTAAKTTKTPDLGIKSNQSLLSKLKANLKENNFIHKHTTKDVGIPPLPTRKNTSSNVKIVSNNNEQASTSTTKKSILCSASAKDISSSESKKQTTGATTQSNSVRIVTDKKEEKKEKQAAKMSACSVVSFDEKSVEQQNKKLSSSSATSIKQQQSEKKLSLGKRLLLSARSSIKGTKSLNNSNNKKLSTSSSTLSKNEKSLSNYDYIHKNISDIDFRRSNSNITMKNNNANNNNNNDTILMYPAITSTLNVINNNNNNNENNIRFIPPKYVNPKVGHNFILKSKSSASPIIVHRQQQIINNNNNSCLGYEKKVATSYQSTPSLVLTENHHHNHNHNNQQRFISRSPSVTSINNNNNNMIQNRTVSVTSVPVVRESRRPTPIMGTNYHQQQHQQQQQQYVRNCSTSASQTDINNVRTKLKSPLEDPKLMSTHLVWNKNSKSAENLDSHFKSTHTIEIKANNNRACSPGISSINSISINNNQQQQQQLLNSNSRENLTENVITFKNSTKIRDSPIQQLGPFTKTVIVVRNDDYFIQPETVTTTTTSTTTSKQQQQQNNESLRKSSSRLDLLDERCISNASIKSFNSGAIKVVPAAPLYTYEMNENAAAILRRNRLREIEENLYKDSSPISFVHQMCQQQAPTRSAEYYHFNQDTTTEYSDNDHEVIDLTKQACMSMDRGCGVSGGKSVDLPIEIYFTNQPNSCNNVVSSRIINMEPFETEFSRSQSSYENNQSIQQQQHQYFSELDNNKQINYVYYYGSNEDFGGY